mmetsp:Transcript_13550/g.24513  ORF Transcript_13550/g.24513 Transcript_13550/m.24513 type:complete len:146 (-) Transcript_13550:1030-1467(-)
MPTHISKRFIAKKVDVALFESMTMANAEDATPNMITANCSGFIFSMAMENIDEPAMQHTMNVEKMTPKGRPSNSPSPTSSLARVVNAGVHMKTKMYMEPSKSDEMIPQDRMSGLRMVTEKAPLRAWVAEDFPALLLSSSSALFSP